jgi:branched-chain amino acid transport system substrate-binding protein
MTRRRGPRHRVAFIVCLALLLAACSVLLAACGGGSSSSSTESSGEANSKETENAAAENEGEGASENSGEPIGIAGLEGEVAEGGPDFMKGMKIATEEINKAGGVNGREIDLKIFKTGGTPQGAASAYQQAGAESQIIGAFLGATGSLAIREQSERVKLALIAASGNDKIDTPVTKYIFENSAGREYASSSLVYLNEHGPEYAKAFNREFNGTDLKGKKVAILHYETDFSQQIPEAIEEGCEQMGCEVIDVEEAGSADSVEAVTPQLTKMKESGAEIYYIESLNPNALAAAKQLGMDSKPVIAEQWLTVPAVAEAAGKNAEGVVFGGHKCRAPEIIAKSDPAKKWCEEYVEKFEKEFPGEPFALFSIYGYDAVNTYAWAVEHLEEEGKEVTRDSIVEAMQEMDGSLRTSHGLVKTSPESHRLTGSWEEAYVDMTIKVNSKGEPEYVIAPGANPAGAKATGPHAE